jgi:hypothetical protein
MSLDRCNVSGVLTSTIIKDTGITQDQINSQCIPCLPLAHLQSVPRWCVLQLTKAACSSQSSGWALFYSRYPPISSSKG